MILAAAVILGTVTAFYFLFFFFFPLGRGAVFFPSSPAHTSAMVALVGPRTGEKAADLGSGDGRVVIALARAGAEAHGFEINPALVLLSRWRVRRSGLTDQARIHWGSFWRADLSPFHVVTVFQGSFIMRRLERKALRELRPGARLVSDYWGFPTLKPDSLSGTLFLYRVNGAR